MILEQWDITRFLPYSKNPRKNDKAVDKMIASIKQFGFKIPILAKSDGTVIDGHLRLKAALKLELNNLPVLLCDDLSEAQIKAFRIMVNKSVAWAEWDDKFLADEFLDLKDIDFDLQMTGFDQLEIDNILAKMEVQELPVENAVVPDGDPNVLIKISVPAAVWLGKRDEIQAVFERMKKNYLCSVKVDE